jgi:hypothetical protein
VKQSLQVLALTMIDPRTNLLELIVVPDKESRTMDCTFDRSWLCCYQDPLSVFMTKELNSPESNFKNSFNPMESRQ